MMPSKFNNFGLNLPLALIFFLTLAVPHIAITQSIESLYPIQSPQKQSLVVDYMGEDAGASILVGFFYLDIDTDKDGLSDFFETAPGDDLDGDGLINSVDPDDDNDGILDALDVEPVGVTSMPGSYFENGTVAEANGNLAGDYWQFLPNSTITAGTYTGYYELPATYLYIDNNVNLIPDVLEYNANTMSPYVVEQNFAATHVINGAFNGLLGDWEYSGSPGATVAERTHANGRTIFYICDDDNATFQTPDYALSPYFSLYSDTYSNINAEIDYDIYGTSNPLSVAIPQPVYGIDAFGTDYFKYRWFDNLVIDPNRNIIFFSTVFWTSGGSDVNTFYAKTEFNADTPPTNPTVNAETTGDNFGGGTMMDWFPAFQDTADHDLLAADVFGAGMTWAMIATAPTGGASPVAVNPANQPWVDLYENWTPDTKILQYRAVADWIGGNPANLHTVIPNRYGYDLTLDGQHVIVRAKGGKMAHMMVVQPQGDPNSFLIGVEDISGGGDRDFEDEVFYLTYFSNPVITAHKTDNFTVNQCTDTINYDIVINNYGAITATGLTFDDTLDINTSLVVGSVTTTLGTVNVGNTAGDITIQVNAGSLPVGDSLIISFNAVVNPGVFPGIDTISNQGHVSGFNFSPVLTGDPTASTNFYPTVTDLATMIDSTAPLITCPSNQNVNFDAACQYILLDYTAMAITSDNCATIVTVTQNPLPGIAITDTVIITLVADDGNGNLDSCTFEVFPSDNTNPTIICPANQNVNLDATCQYTLLDYTGMATAADNCNTSPTITQTPTAGTVITTTTTITLTVDDGSGNTNTCTFDVIPSDNTAPTMTCPANQNVSFDATCQYTLLDYTGMATATDNCAATPTITQAPTAGTVITTTTTITLTADDGNGNTNTCTFDVIPSDNTQPTITCPANQNVNLDATCQYTLLDYTGMATAADNCTATPTITQAPAAGTVITTTTTITLTADDGNGNTNTCTFDVIPADNTAPTMTCPANQNVNLDATCQYTLLDYTGMATAADNCAATPTITQAPAAGTVITTTTTITLTVDDGSGNTNTCTFDVIPSDNTAPTMTCPANQNVSFDATCQYTLLDYTGMATATDNCAATPTITQAPTAGTVITTTTTITLTADDGNGNTNTCTFDVIPTDNTAPTITCPGNQNVGFDAACQFVLPDYSGTVVVTDNCNPTPTLTQNPVAGTIITGTTTITFTADDGNGNTNTCTFDVVATDNVNPTITCPANQNVSLDATCQYTLLDYTGMATAADNCNTSPTITQVPVAGTVISSTTTITLTVDDGSGNTNTCTFDVIPSDNTQPTITCPTNQNVNLDAACQYTLLDYTGMATATDNCAATPTITQAPAAGTVITTTTTITLTADDGNGNTNTCTFDVIPSDNTAPTITCPANQNVNLDATCQYTLLDYTGMATAADNCAATPTITQAPAAGTVITTMTTITLIADDGNGNTNTCTFDVIPADNTVPTITCPANQNVNLDTTCQYTLLDYTGMATAADNCNTSPTITQVPVAGTVISSTTTITLTADDGNGNTNTCTFDVIPSDNTAPTITCPANQNVNLDATCQYTLLDYTGMATATDNCAATPTITQAPAAGTVITTTTTITLTADDGNGNTNTCTFDVIPADNTAPTITCPGNQNVNFDATCQFMLPDYTGVILAADNCNPTPTLTQNPIAGTVITGTTTITFTVDDGNGNSNTCSFDVIPIDNTPPTVVCQSSTFYLDPLGNVNITTLDIDNGSSDGCGLASLSLSTSNFICSDVGPNTIYLIATDNAGNIDSCTAIVTILDTIAPTLICQNTTIFLGPLGNGTITPSDIDNGSSDACGINSLTASNTNFTCSEIGTNTVYLIATDNNGNTDSCSAIVIVTDTILPNVTCQNLTVYLDASGNASILPSDVDNGSNDACGILNMSLSNANFSCNDIGVNAVYLSVTDNNGNIDSCLASVTILDTIPPNVICQNSTIYLDPLGNAALTVSDIDNGSNDSCGIASSILSNANFNCTNLGSNLIYLIVTDSNGNTDSCSATVTVLDTIPPSPVCQNINAYLDVTGVVTITPNAIDNMSTDACGIMNLSLSDTSFSCQDIGPNIIYLIAVDSSGNMDSCQSTVTVLDTILPTVICQNINAYLDINGTATINPVDIDNGSTDACGISTLALSNSSFDCSNLGTNIIYLVATDNSGNIDSCQASVIILDTINPTLICQDITLNLDINGLANIQPSSIDNGSNDACGINTLTISKTDFSCADIGQNFVTLIASDSSGNVDSCQAIVSVVDLVPPTVICQDIAVYLDGAGNAIITPANIDNGTSDACGIASLTLSDSTFDCSDIGITTAYLIAIDNHGNIDSCLTAITIVDTVSPVISCKENLIEYLDNNCLFTIPNYTATISDNCNEDNDLVLTQNPSTGTIVGGIGSTHIITMSVTDASNNLSSCAFSITLEDNTPPTLSCPQDQTSLTDYSCQFTIEDYSYLVTNVFDDCDFDSVLVTQIPAPGSLVAAQKLPGNATQGQSIVTLFVEDLSGNRDSCEFTVHLTCITELFVPQLLSPNNDGKNDILIIDGLEIFPNNKLIIFNRWGNIVYEASPYLNDWSGEATKAVYGQEVPDGSYFYTLELNEEEEKLTGYIIIKR